MSSLNWIIGHPVGVQRIGCWCGEKNHPTGYLCGGGEWEWRSGEKTVRAPGMHWRWQCANNTASTLDIFLSASHIELIGLWSRYYYSHHTEPESWGTERLSNLLKATVLVSGKAEYKSWQSAPQSLSVTFILCYWLLEIWLSQLCIWHLITLYSTARSLST